MKQKILNLLKGNTGENLGDLWYADDCLCNMKSLIHVE